MQVKNLIQAWQQKEKRWWKDEMQYNVWMNGGMGLGWGDMS